MSGKVPQPELNIGMVGHVDHGKTTLTEALSGIWTDTHSEELKRGITIYLGYADTSFYRCPKCEFPKNHTTKEVCPHCGSKTVFLRRVSFVDAPGHETLLTTMLAGAAIMDGALLLVAANEPCPQPQTREHLLALEFMGLDRIVIVQNKIDIVSEERARENYKEITEFVKGTIAEGAPIIPVSAHFDANIDVLIYAIEKMIPTPPKKRLEEPFRMHIARSFDVNRPGTHWKDLVGGIIGGSITRGRVRVGDEIEIVPGITGKDSKTGKYFYEPISTEVTSLKCGTVEYDELTPGGLAAIGTKLDPTLTKKDQLRGAIVGAPGTLPPVREHIVLETHLMEYVVGLSTQQKVEKIKTGDMLLLNIGTANTIGVVTSPREDTIEMRLTMPVAAEDGQRVALSKRVGGRYHIIGYGIITG
ncbi:MAG: translation initiation factor IF-2 subunit gamma [Thermoplasmata archaeon]|nr:MAG: translation initiation factor IF-2 subunit gamma [Thermoplasmata archaeon]